MTGLKLKATLFLVGNYKADRGCQSASIDNKRSFN